MDGALLIGQSDVVLIGGNDHIGGILNEVIGTQVANIVFADTAHGTGGVGIRHGLVLDGDGLIQLIGVGIKVSQVEHGSHAPVAVERQIGNAQIDVSTALGLQGDEAFHIHAVGEGGIQISLVLIGQSDLHIDLLGLTGSHGDLVVLHDLALSIGQFHNGTGQLIGFLGDGGLAGVGLGLADTLGGDQGADPVAQLLVAEVGDLEGHLINAGALGVIPQFQLGGVHLGAVSGKGGDVGGSPGGACQVGKAGALLTHGVGQAVGIQRHISGGHDQLVDHGADLHVVIGNLGEVLHHILPQQHHHAGQVGAGHRGTGQTVIAAAGDGGEDVAAVGSDLRLDLQAGTGAPGGEVGDEGAGSLLLADLQLAAAGFHQHLAVILGNGAHSQFGFAHIHFNITGYIIIYNDTGSALGFGDHGLLLEGVVAAADQSDLAFHIHAGVVGGTAHAGDDHILQSHGVLVAQQGLTEIIFLGGAVVGLVEVNDGLIIEQVGSLLTCDGSNRQGACICTGRTDGGGVGIGGQAQIAVGLGAVGRGVGVGSGNHNADAGFTEFVIHAAELLFIGFPAEAAGGTQGHIDHIHAQDHTVLQGIQDPGTPGGVHDVGEDLHGNDLSIRGNTGNGVILTHDDTGDMGAVVVVGGVNIRVIIGVVIAKGNLLVDIDIVHTQGTCQGVGLGLFQDRRHILVGQTQLFGGKVLHREGTVIGIQTGVQNRHHHAAAVVNRVGAVEDTGGVNIDGVFHQFRFGSLIDLAHNGLCTLVQGHAHRLEIGSPDHQFKAGQQNGVLLAQRVGDPLLIQISQNLSLPGLDAGLNGLGIGREGKLTHGHGFVGSFIGRHQVGGIQINDD